jgi:hypothetical protein
MSFAIQLAPDVLELQTRSYDEIDSAFAAAAWPLADGSVVPEDGAFDLTASQDNLDTAEALRIDAPQSVLLQAMRVVQ